MAISNGQPVDASNSNAAWVSKSTDDTKVGKLALNNPTSGGNIADTQQQINDNTGDIATNATNIATNATNIAQNASDITDINNSVGAANGIAPLDGSSYVPLANINPALFGGPKFIGTWDADTNTPTLSDGGATTSPSQGDYYRISAPGATLIDGNDDWGIGDWIIFNGTAWDKIDNSESVTGGVVKVDMYDPTSTTLPGGASATFDGVALQNDDLVAFSNLGVGNFRVYKASGVGTSIVWEAQKLFPGDLEDPTQGDLLYIRKGELFSDQIGKFTGSEFNFNKTIRLFDGTNHIEIGAPKGLTLSDNSSGLIFSVAYTNSENWRVEYSIVRGTNRRTGTLQILTDGTDVQVNDVGADINDSEVSFFGIINGTDLELHYLTSNQGQDAFLNYWTQRFSDNSVGPAGPPSYTATATSTPAAGSIGDVQFKGSSGNLEADSDFRFEQADDALNMNGAQMVKKLTSVLADNTTVATTFYSYDYTQFRHLSIFYGVERGSNYRTGELKIAGNPTPGFADEYVEAGSTGLIFAVSTSGSTLNVQFISTSTGNDATINYQVRRM